MKLKPSRYTLVHPMGDASNMIYNTASGALLCLDKATSEAVVPFLEGRGEQSSQLPFGIQERLIYGGFVVPDGVDEVSELRLGRDRRRVNMDSLGLTICPTLKCNLRCAYCFESEQESGLEMDDLVAEQLVEFVRGRMELGTKSLTITWYGGEPLLRLDRIASLQKAFSSIVRIERTSIITNGTLLSPENYRRLADIGVQHIQVTLDGNRSTHDTRRPWRGTRGGTYDDIVDNLRRIELADAEISIRVNVDRSNASCFIDLVRDLASDARLARYLKTTYPAEVIGWPSLPCDWRASCLETPAFSRLMIQLADEMRGICGLDFLRLPRPSGLSCSALHENSFIVGPKGEMYRCWTDVGDEKEIAGYLNTKLRPNWDLQSRWNSWDPFSNRQCADCMLLPICGGGCPAKVKQGVTADGAPSCHTAKYNLGDVISRVQRG